MLRWVLLLVLAVSTTGCLEYGKDVRTDVTHLDDVDYAPNASDILVLFGVSEPSFAYQQIAFIEVTGNREATVDLLLKKLKRKAAGLGAGVLELTGGRKVLESTKAGVGAGVGTLAGRVVKLVAAAIIWLIIAVAAFWP